MVVIKTRNGKVYRNSDIKSWNIFKPDSEIVSITLTDGNGMSSTLTGFESYVYEIEAVSGYSVGSGNPIKNAITAEFVYGYRNLQHIKDNLKMTLSNRLIAISNSQPEIKHESLINHAQRMYEHMITKVEKKEVGAISLGLNFNVIPKSRGSFSAAVLKNGVGNNLQPRDVLGARYNKKL